MFEVLQNNTDCFVFPHLEKFALEILSTLCSLVMKSTDKNSCTRALWVISKQSFPANVVAKKVSKEQRIELRKTKRQWYLNVGVILGQVPSILDTLDGVWSREDVQSVVLEHEALNVIMR